MRHLKAGHSRRPLRFSELIKLILLLFENVDWDIGAPVLSVGSSVEESVVLENIGVFPPQSSISKLLFRIIFWLTAGICHFPT